MAGSSAQPAENDRFLTLDGLRGIAAIAVAIFHWGTGKTQLVPNGYLSVDFFLMLSGFVIARNYIPSMTSGRLSPNRFVVMRIVRLYPLFLLGVLMGLFLYSFSLLKDGWHPGDGHLFVSFFFNALVLPSPVDEELFPLNNPGWSLFYEFVINIVFAYLLFRLSPRWLVVVTIAGLVALLLTIGPRYNFGAGWNWESIEGGLARTLFAFPLGMLFYYWTVRLPRSYSLFWGLGTAALLVFVLAFPAAALLGRPAQYYYDYFVVLAICPLLLFAGIRYQVPQRLKRVFAFLGDISYPLYATHKAMLNISGSIVKRLGLPEFAQLGIFVVIMILFAWSAGHFYDGPVRKWLNRRLHQRRSAQPQVIAD